MGLLSGFVDNKPDYELADTVELTRPDQLKAIGDPLRFTILGLLSEQAATTSQLADALERPRGTIGHHVKVLEQAGLVRVVRTRPVRGLTEKYYGRVARLSILADSLAGAEGLALRQALNELAQAPADAPRPYMGIRHARLTPEAAEDLAERIHALFDEVEADADPDSPVWGMVTGVYQTAWPSLEDEAASSVPVEAEASP
jgi:DNA-binding transcriptional ArsR family regulator